MHPQAREFVARQVASRAFPTVLEIGSRDINGTVRDLFGDADYLGLDVSEGPGVDVVADVTAFKTRRKFDAVVCCEVLEHAENAAGIIAAARGLLRPGGVLIVTAATDPRAPHSAVDGGPVHPGEFYRNVSPAALRGWLAGFATTDIDVDDAHGDIRAVATR